MRQPFVSIITPVYNAERYLPECIESVLNQTCGDWELILVDDGSTDNSSTICSEYSEYDTRITVIHQKNLGQFPSRMRGINVANGMYCTGLDSDDYLEANFVELLKKTVDVYPADIICWNIKYIFENKEIGMSSKEHYGYYKNQEFIEYVCRSSDHSFCNKLIRMQILKDSKYGLVPNSRNSEDYIQICPSICKADTVYAIEDALYNYRQVATSVTHVINGKSIIDNLDSEQCVLDIYNYYEKLDSKIEKIEYSCLVRTIGYGIKQSIKSSTISKEDAYIIRNHPIFKSIKKYERIRYCTLDIIFVLKLFRLGLNGVLRQLYENR